MPASLASKKAQGDRRPPGFRSNDQHVNAIVSFDASDSSVTEYLLREPLCQGRHGVNVSGSDL